MGARGLLHASLFALAIQCIQSMSLHTGGFEMDMEPMDEGLTYSTPSMRLPSIPAQVAIDLTQPKNDTSPLSRFDKLRSLEVRNYEKREASSYSELEVASKVSLVIKTFERSSCLLTYIKSIRQFYPNLKVLIADDSKKIAATSEAIMKMPNIFYYPLPFDTGVSAGRNFLLDHVDTPYFVVSDDDNIFTNATQLENLLAEIENTGADIVGACNVEGNDNCIGDWDLFHRNRIRVGLNMSEGPMYSTLQVREVPHKYMEKVIQRSGEYDIKSPYCKEADMVANFFMARTALISEKIRWDPAFKVGEHEDFFYRAKLMRSSIRFCTNTKVNHEHFTCLKSADDHFKYKQFRDRVRTMINHFFEVHKPIVKLEMPWATVKWTCACDDEQYAVEHSEECMSSERTDCKAVWDTDHVTTPSQTDRMQKAMEQPVELQDNTPYAFVNAATDEVAVDGRLEPFMEPKIQMEDTKMIELTHELISEKTKEVQEVQSSVIKSMLY